MARVRCFTSLFGFRSQRETNRGVGVALCCRVRGQSFGAKPKRNLRHRTLQTLSSTGAADSVRRLSAELRLARSLDV